MPGSSLFVIRHSLRSKTHFAGVSERQTTTTQASTGASKHVNKKNSKNSGDRHLQNQDFIVDSVHLARAVKVSVSKAPDRGLGATVGSLASYCVTEVFRL